jgi:hypothetical protein
LNAVSRNLVVKMSSRSSGALLMENPRVFPSASVSGGWSKVRSMN